MECHFVVVVCVQITQMNMRKACRFIQNDLSPSVAVLWFLPLPSTLRGRVKVDLVKKISQVRHPEASIPSGWDGVISGFQQA